MIDVYGLFRNSVVGLLYVHTASSQPQPGREMEVSANRQFGPMQ